LLVVRFDLISIVHFSIW